MNEELTQYLIAQLQRRYSSHQLDDLGLLLPTKVILHDDKIPPDTLLWRLVCQECYAPPPLGEIRGPLVPNDLSVVDCVNSLAVAYGRQIWTYLTGQCGRCNAVHAVYRSTYSRG